MASRYPKAYRSITLLCFAVDASDQSVSLYCKRLVPTCTWSQVATKARFTHYPLPSTRTWNNLQSMHKLVRLPDLSDQCLFFCSPGTGDLPSTYIHWATYVSCALARRSIVGSLACMHGMLNTLPRCVA
jgi:hypothetical protein